MNFCSRLFVIAKMSPFDNIYLRYLVFWFSDCTDLSVSMSKPRPRTHGNSTSQATHTRQLPSTQGTKHFNYILAFSISYRLLLSNPHFCGQTLEICRYYDLDNVSTIIMKVNMDSNVAQLFVTNKKLGHGIMIILCFGCLLRTSTCSLHFHCSQLNSTLA